VSGVSSTDAPAPDALTVTWGAGSDEAIWSGGVPFVPVGENSVNTWAPLPRSIRECRGGSWGDHAVPGDHGHLPPP